MKLKGLIIPVFMVVAIGGAFFVPRDVVVLWVLLCAALGAGLREWFFPDLKQSVDYRPYENCVIIHYDNVKPVKIVSPEGKIVWASMTPDRKLWIYDDGLNPYEALVAVNSLRKVFLKAGTLDLTCLNKKGYKISWPKGQSWSVVI